VLYEHIRENRPKNVLELGTARGGSAVFIAAALEANGAGHLMSVDSTRWQWLDPTPREVLEKAGLSSWVTLDKRFSTYTWFLKAEIEKRLEEAGSARPEYDFIFLDGAKNWSAESRRTKGGVLSGRNDARGARARLRRVSRRVWRHLPPATQRRIQGLQHTAARPSQH